MAVWRKLILWGGLGVSALALAAVALAYGVLRASLPPLDGEVTLAGLEQEVVIERDELGVATLTGANRLDLSRAMGFLHAQERLFQMDLLRRTSSGEIAAVVGPQARDWDIYIRRHRLRHRAKGILTALSDAERRHLEAYANGVNAGIDHLAAAPFEYWLFNQSPRPWQPEDSLLVVFAMYLQLQDPEGIFEELRGLLTDTVGVAVADFLMPPGTPWDAPLVGESMAPPPIPGPEFFDARRLALADTAPAPVVATAPHHPLWGPAPRVALGSNNFAVGGALTDHGGAILANDMHLALRVPNTWYRLALVYPGDDGGQRRVVGLTLAGTPVVAVGSNGDVAWGFTNSYGDWTDLITLLPGEGDNHYRTPDGEAPLVTFTETIAVAGEESVEVSYLETPWGPLGNPDLAGHPRAVRWVGHTARAVNLGLLNLEGARDADEALTLAASLGIPAQNILVADRKGTIGWTLAGPIPRRQGSDGRLPSVSPRPGRWVGWLEPEDYPRILAPADHRLWTANNRVVAGEALALLGDGGLELGARAGQIRQGLTARDSFDEAALLAIQLDYRAQFLARWRRLLLDTLGSETLVGHPQRAALRRVVAAGAKRAAVDDAGYRLVREFRAAVLARILEPVIQVVQAQGDGREPYRERLVQLEGALWQLVSHRPHHWLAPAYADWQALLLAAVDNVAAAVTRSTPDVADYTWGRHNTLAMAHPLSLVLPSLGDWLNMPPVPLPGDIHMPRVQRPGAGASVRLVVAPGREEQALCHMPGGQSGHPLSPFYRLGHAAWAAGEATPLLPGPAQHRLVLNPGS